MQTFLPYPDFVESAACLDTRRLGKQRVEVLQLLKALLVHDSGWSNHPAAKMWQGSEPSLAAYGFDICKEWISRGYADTCLDKIVALCKPQWDWFDPFWLGDPLFHASHRSNLLRKDYAYYSRFGWTESNDLPYIWPSAETHSLL